MRSYFRLHAMICMVAALCVAASSAKAQPAIFSFEDGIDPWTTPNGTISQTSFGATDGTSALLMEDITAPLPANNFKNLATTPNFGPATAGLTDAFAAFDLAAQVIAAGGTPNLEFDLTWDFSAATSPEAGGYVQLGLFVNSSGAGGGGFKQLGTGNFLTANISTAVGFSQWPGLGPASVNDGVTLTPLSPTSTRISVPFGTGKTMTLSSTSTFFDIGFQTNGRWDGTIDFAVDNIKFTGVPIFEEHTLFSWETPDDPGTPGVNEQFEGWASAQTPPTQNLSITTTGATDGGFALEVDRTVMPAGFTWGSAFALDAVANPADQARIDDLVSRVNGATQIAIDVTYEDQFPISPSYTHLSLAFADESGAYFQASAPSFDITEATGGPTTQTLIFDIADFDDFNSPKNLAVDGLMVGTTQLGVVLGTGSDDGPVFQIDNLRVISEVVDDQPGDFNGDGDVDGRDFLAWQRGNSPNPLSASDLAEWQANYGTAGPLAAVGSVPEPTALSLVVITALTLLVRRQQF